jgi:hypothetical protein
VIRAVGRQVAEDKGRAAVPPTRLEQVRRSGKIVEAEVAPTAEHIHRHDDLVSEAFIAKMGRSGTSVYRFPSNTAALEMGNLAMIP